jgi:hypothetical protein
LTRTIYCPLQGFVDQHFILHFISFAILSNPGVFDKDSKVIVWNLEQVNPVQIINLKDICGEELKDEELVGVDRFDYNKNSNTLCVHPFG